MPQDLDLKQSKTSLWPQAFHAASLKREAIDGHVGKPYQAVIDPQKNLYSKGM